MFWAEERFTAEGAENAESIQERRVLLPLFFLCALRVLSAVEKAFSRSKRTQWVHFRLGAGSVS